ncbi:polysaccharide export protein [bacterium]|nr:polysaccharide export protein [bacterium]
MSRLNAALIVLALFSFASITFAADGQLPAEIPSVPTEVQGQSSAQPANDDVPADYKIAEEDILRMDVWGEPQLSNMEMQVTPDGKINVPYIGEMQAKGLTQYKLTEQIAEKFVGLEILIDPKVQISLINIHKPTVRVWGAVNRPGEVQFKEGDRVMDAVAGAGSYVIDAAWLEKATLTRKDSETGNWISMPVDLKKMVAQGDLTQNYELQKGDTIYIPTEDYQNKFYVLGQVLKPGIYDLKDNTTVLSAISLAGGATDRGRLRSTVVVRGDPSKPERVECNLTGLFDKGDLTQDIQLQPGDIVVVPETKTPDLSKIASFISSLVNLSYLRRNGF